MAAQGKVYDVIVIGAGIEGSSSAYSLAKENQKVLLLEQFPLPHSRGSSGGHSRITRYVYSDEFYVHMMTDCFPLWDQLAQETKTQLLIPCGTLDVRPAGSAGQAQVIEHLRKFQVTHEILDPREVKERFPMLSPGPGIGAIWDPSGGVLRADKCLAAYHKMVRHFGGELRDAEPVTSVIPGDIVTVVTSRGLYKAPKVVIAAGPWAGKLASSLGLQLPLNPIRISVLYWTPSPGKEKEHTSDKLPCIVDNRKPGGAFHIYSLPTDEYPALVKVCLHTGPDISPDARDRVNTQWVKESVSKTVKELFPWLQHDAPTIEETCIYTMTPDYHPYIGQHPQHSNIVLAAGFSGHGFKLAPAVGKAVRELVLNQKLSYDMAPFRVARFSPKATL